MKLAYVDTSSLVAIALGEPGGEALARRLSGFDRLLTSNLTEAELRAAFHREEVEKAAGFLDALTWFFPDRPLTAEYKRVLEHGPQNGADLFHLACALFLHESLDGELIFVSSDRGQSKTARRLGLQ